MVRKLAGLVLAAMLLVSCGEKDDSQYPDEDLAITVSGTSREFAFTNKRFGQYYGETNREFTNGWMGWTYREENIFRDYGFSLDGVKLKRGAATVRVLPWLLERDYPGGVTEQLFFPDSLNALFISLSNLQADTVVFSLSECIPEDVQITDSLLTAPISNYGETIYLTIESSTPLISFLCRHGSFSVTMEGASELNLIISLQQEPKGSELRGALPGLLAGKKSRILEHLNANRVTTNIPEFNKAWLWALASMDALVVEQHRKGLFAGLPWFNNYWGRDTFISLPGAALTTNQYQDARDILKTFASKQQTDTSSPDYGRIPNFITLQNAEYNTADGTPRFVSQVREYFRYTADTTLVRELYPVIEKAYYGAMKQRVDKQGFLTHGNAETWMDAAGPDGAWSPRGSRANDLQALWYRQLKATSYLASLMQDSTLAAEADTTAAFLAGNFAPAFFDTIEIRMADRLTSEGTKDFTWRPNLFFVLNEPALLPDFRQRLELLDKAMERLVLPYGVLSLNPENENFHPYHEYPPFYPKDAAYHNGVIWQWLTGPVVETLCGFHMADTAWRLTSSLTDEILNRGAVGTLAELREAYPRAGKEQELLSGAYSQAWSLAEYIRTIRQEYLGVKPDAPNKALYLIPTLPTALTQVSFTQRIGDDQVTIEYQFNHDIQRILITGDSIADTLDIGVALMTRANASYQFKTDIAQGQRLDIEVPSYAREAAALQVMRDMHKIQVNGNLFVDPEENRRLYEQINFAEPQMPDSIAALEPPPYSLLTNNFVKRYNPQAELLFDVSDDTHDEVYEYPRYSQFVDGILDLEHFTLRADSSRYYFNLRYRMLHNPGWHHEYGFQLTYSAILLQTGSGETTRNAGENSRYTLPPERAYTVKINLGGGLRVTSADGSTIAAYVPQKEDYYSPLGNTGERTISFSLPSRLLGDIDRSTVITVLTGAQDDHGGAGIGEFRTVRAKVSDWHGGGKKKADAHNVYDFLEIN